MPDASPIRWHLAHTTWFFETFVLKSLHEYEPFHADFEFLFNSYYNSVGEQFPRNQRGLITRPSVRQVWQYRDFVDLKMVALLSTDDHESKRMAELNSVVELGLQHEQQHQELMLADIKHALWCNPLLPSYHSDRFRLHDSDAATSPMEPAAPLGWCNFTEGVYEFGHHGDSFAFDNESPRHRAYIHDFRLAHRLVTSAEYLAFMNDGGYERPEFWLSLGWTTVKEQQWVSPFYWQQRDGRWYEFTLAGARPLDLNSPVCHVSYFEADAFARWSGKRLPTEFEWELAAESSDVYGNFADSHENDDRLYHPRVAGSPDNKAPQQMFGDVWEWTASQYMPYPGFQPATGALGEYNGKFMCNQFVLRGGSCATSQSHIRRTYRNFFPPDARWQFSGIRLVE
jgi:ergothioneine biosynthesis protein EgtB